MNRKIYYSINSNPRYVDYTKYSIGSLRRVNREIPAALCCFGTLSGEELRWFDDHGVRVIIKPEVDHSRVTSLKWLSLPELVDTERLLFADADTWFYRDPEVVFETFHEHAFYAREETGTSPTLPPEQCQIHHDRLALILDMADARKVPIFNTGVMIFNHFIHRELVEGLSMFMELLDLFQRGEVPYPCDNWHLRDEVIASIVFGAAEQFSWQFLPATVSPWYEELKSGVVTDPGVILHVWHRYWQEFLDGQLGTLARAPAGV